MANFILQVPNSLRSFTVSASISSNGSPPLNSSGSSGAGGGPVILELPLDKIRRPLMRTRANDPIKVQELMDSIQEIGLQIPIDVLEVDGVYYGMLLSSIFKKSYCSSHFFFKNHWRLLVQRIEKGKKRQKKHLFVPEYHCQICVFSIIAHDLVVLCRFLRLSSLRSSPASWAPNNTLQNSTWNKRNSPASPPLTTLCGLAW